MSRLFKQLLAEKVIDQDVEVELEKSHADLKLVSSQEEPIVTPQASPYVPSRKSPKLGKTFIVSVLLIFLSAQWYFFKNVRNQPVLSVPVATTVKTEEKVVEKTSSKTGDAANILPSDAEINANAVRLFKNNAFTASYDQFSLLLKKHPDSAEIMNNLGMSLLKLKRQKHAKEFFIAAIKKSPASAGTVLASAYNNLGSVNLEEKHYSEAIFNFQKSVLLDHALVEGRLNLGRAFELAGKTDDAILAYESYVALPSADATLKETLKKRIVKMKQMGKTAKSEE